MPEVLRPWSVRPSRHRADHVSLPHVQRHWPGSGMIALTVRQFPHAPWLWVISHPNRLDKVICRATTPSKAAAIAAQEWAIEPDAYTVTQEEAP